VVSFAGKVFEISSMGIRVDENSLLSQLKKPVARKERNEIPQRFASRKAPLHHWRGYRTVEDLHVFSEEGSYRRGSIFGMAGFND